MTNSNKPTKYSYRRHLYTYFGYIGERYIKLGISDAVYLHKELNIREIKTIKQRYEAIGS